MQSNYMFLRVLKSIRVFFVLLFIAFTNIVSADVLTNIGANFLVEGVGAILGAIDDINDSSSDLSPEAEAELDKFSNISYDRKKTMSSYDAIDKGNKYYYRRSKDYENAIKWYMEAYRISNGSNGGNQLKAIREEIGRSKFEKYKNMFSNLDGTDASNKENVSSRYNGKDERIFASNSNVKTSKYINRVLAKVKNNWRYNGAKDYWGCDVHIWRDVGGEVLSVELKSCKIDEPARAKSFKDSIERAIYKSSPLPTKTNERARDLKITFYFAVGDDNKKYKVVKNSNNNNNKSFSDLWEQYGGNIIGSYEEGYSTNPTYKSKSKSDNSPPKITLNQKDFITVTKSSVSISGLVSDDSDVSEVNINGSLVEIDNSGRFNKSIWPKIGKNKYIVEAFDMFGNKSSKAISVVRNLPVVKNIDKKLSPPTTQLTSNPNSVALIIGLDRYQNMPNAPWAESDAATFYDYANNVLGIPPERIRLITGEKSSRAGIWKQLSQWLPSQVDKNKSNVYVYFAGHGLASDNGKEAYLMPYDGDTSMLQWTAVQRKDVINGLKKLNAKSVTMFMDTCYSGSARGGKQTLVASRGLRIVKKNTLSDLPSNFTLFSAAANDETAISHPTQKNGLFSYWMMRGLGGEADSNNDRKLTNGELHSFISDKVQKTAISKGHKQHPQLVGDKDKVIASW